MPGICGNTRHSNHESVSENHWLDFPRDDSAAASSASFEIPLLHPPVVLVDLFRDNCLRDTFLIFRDDPGSSGRSVRTILSGRKFVAVLGVYRSLRRR